MDNKFFQQIAERLANKPSVPTRDEILANPAGYSIISKLITSRGDDSFKNDGKLSDVTPDLDYMLGISAEKAQEIDDNEAIMQLLPDFERISQILISYILSPKYLLKPELQYLPPKNIFPQTVASQIVESIYRYVSRDYHLDNRLYGYLYDILFTKGAHPVAVIPEASLDEIINSDLETAQESYSYQLSLESLDSISTKLDNTVRVSKGFLGNPSYAKVTKVNSTNLSRESFEIGHGDTDKVSTISTDPVFKYESKIQAPKNIEFMLPRELVEAHRSSSVKSKDIHISTEGVWNINLAKVDDTLIEVTDDLSILHQNYAKQKAIKKEVNRRIGLSTEHFRGLKDINGSDKNIIEKIFKNIDNTYRTKPIDPLQMRSVKTNEQTYRQNLNEPLIIDYPVEAIIPIFKPGSPEDHIGYLALHDEEGNPVSKTKPINYYRELHNNYNLRTNGTNMASSLIQQGKTMFEGFSNRLDESRQLEILSHIHGNAIIKDILERLKNGIYSNNLDIGESSEVFRIMFYRALRGQRTRILFIPKQLMQYMAFDYDNRGMGRSLLDNMKVLISLRIQFMLAQIRAGIMNSIPETVVTLRIDEKDPDPKKTIQIAQVLALQSRSNAGLLVGASNVQTIEDRINQSNIRMAIESDNPKVPNIGQDVSRNTADIPTPDQDTMENLIKLTTTGFGLTPQMVDSSYEAEFATSVIQNNFLTNLISFQKQERFNPQITEFVKKIIQSSPILLRDIEQTIRSNLSVILENIKEASGGDIDYSQLGKDSLEVIVDYLKEKCIELLVVTLPVPTNDNNDAKVEQMSRYEERIDKAISYIVNSEVLPQDIVGEEAAEFVNTYGPIIKAHLMRQWMIDNDYLPEIMDFFTVSNKGDQTYEKNQEIREMSIKAVKAVMEFFKEGKNIAESTSAVAKANDMQAEDSGGYSSDSDSGDDFGDFEDEGGFEESFESEEFGSDMGADESQDGAADA